jgi:hypothetical protein
LYLLEEYSLMGVVEKLLPKEKQETLHQLYATDEE